MVRSIAKLTFAVAFSAFIVPAQAVEVLTNGNFDSGLTGWTSYTTANGTIAAIPSTPGSPQPQSASVVSFNVTGSGASNALFLNAGVANPPYGTSQQGGGVTQTFTTSGGLATFSADIAAFTRVAGDGGLGLLSVLLDGVVLDSYDFGGANGPITLRSTLDFTTSLTAGSHTLSLQATRLFAPSAGVRSQYFDNVSLDVTAPVPEPSTWAMIILGFAGVGFMAYRRRNGAMIGA
jgi:PEP-CTERM motif